MGNHRGIKENKERYLYGHCIIQNRVIYFEAKYRAVSVTQARYYLCLNLREYFNTNEYVKPVIYDAGTFTSTLFRFRKTLPTFRCFVDYNYVCKIERGTPLGLANARLAFGFTDEDIKMASINYVLDVVNNTIEASNTPLHELVKKIEARGFKMNNVNTGIEHTAYIVYNANNQIVLSTNYRRELLRFIKHIERNNLNNGLLII